MTSKIVVNNIEPDAGISTVSILGIATATNFKTGSSNLHSTGLNVNNTFVHSTGIALGAGSTIGAVTGVTTYYGDGSQLSGISVDSTKIETGNTKVETIDTGSNGHVKFTLEGAEKLRIDHNGMVMLNTTTATRRLSIKDPAQIYLESTDTGNWSGIQIKGSSGTNNYNAYFGLLDSNGNFFIDNGSNGNDFIIKPTGQIEMPNQPMVRFSGNWTYTSWNSHQQVVMNGEQEDKGGNFSNGIFTVPTGGEGVYVISAQYIGPSSAGQYFLWQFYKNTTGLNPWVQGRASAVHEESTSATVAVSCSVGDTLRVAFHNSYAYGYQSGYNTFTIFKVH